MGYGPSGFAANNVVGNYLSGQQAADVGHANLQQARARDQQYQQNVLSQQQGQQALAQQQQAEAAKQLHIASQYALQVPAGQTKTFVEQNFPALVQHAGDKWATSTDDDVRAELQGVAAQSAAQAGIAPPAPVAKWVSGTGPRGSVIQTNPTTGEQKQVVGPDNSQPAAPAPNRYRPLSPQEVTAYGLPPGTTAQIDATTGKVDLINRPTNASAGRPLPPPVIKGLVENNQNIRKIDNAIAALDKYPDAFGAANYWGDSIRQRSDPKGVDPRAKVADIGSLIIHDRSGAAVSASEFPRLAPFIPQATDAPEVVRTKLINLKNNIQMMQEETQQTFSVDQGYKPFEASPGAQPAAQPAPTAAPAPAQGQRLTPQQAAALPSGTPFVGMDGISRVKH